MAEDYRGGGMPLWGWVLVLVALAMLAGMMYRALSTGGYH